MLQITLSKEKLNYIYHLNLCNTQKFFLMSPEEDMYKINKKISTKIKLTYVPD